MGRSFVARHGARILVAVIGGGLLVSPASTVAAGSIQSGNTTLTVAAEADAYVEEADPAANHGDGDLLVDASPALETYLRFAVDGVDDAVERATLRVYAYDGSTDGPAVYGTGSTWEESAITWDTRPPPVGSALDDRGEVGEDTWVEYDVTSLVVGNGRYDFILAPTSTDGVDFYGREHEDNGPRLVVEVSPGGGTDASTSSPAATPAVTPTAAGDTVTAVAAGDIACDPTSGSFRAGNGTDTNCRQRYTAEVVEQLNPDYVLGLGDMQYEEGTLDNYAQSYDLSWGRFKDKTFVAPGGSHDFYGGGDFYAYWGERAGPEPSKNWFSLDAGAWHVVFLNSYCDEVGGCEPGDEQYEWLRSDLTSNTQPCTLALWHEPRYSSGPRHGDDGDVDPLWDLLYAQGADLLLTAHDHDYERFAPMDDRGDRDDDRGLREFVVGTGGKSLDAVEDEEARQHSEVRQGHTYGVLALTLRPDGYDWRFVPEAGQTFTDEGSSACHGGPARQESRAASASLTASVPGTPHSEMGWAGIGGRQALSAAAEGGLPLAGHAVEPARFADPTPERPEHAAKRAPPLASGDRSVWRALDRHEHAVRQEGASSHARALCHRSGS